MASVVVDFLLGASGGVGLLAAAGARIERQAVGVPERNADFLRR
jgi:hypothetical protein